MDGSSTSRTNVLRLPAPGGFPAQARSERGFALIELLIAMVILSIGIAATIGVFGASGRTTVGAQRNDVAAQQAQAEIDKLSTLKYGELALNSMPASSTDPNNPGYRVSGTTLKVKPGLNEDLVLTPGNALTAKVAPGPQSFSVGSGGSKITGKIYRYVTWRDENCPDALCKDTTGNTKDTKRVTVAITVDPSGTQSVRPPVWISSVIADRDTVPPGSTAAPPTGPTVTAQSLYLYDTRCGQTTSQPQTGNHPTHDTASTGSAASSSSCENPDVSKQPDLMGPSLPDGPTTTPLYNYSTDLSGDFAGGIAMNRQGTTCRSSYAADDVINASAPNKWNIHAWSTNAFDSTFLLNGQVTVSLFTETVDGVDGAGVVCATLLDRQLSGGAPQDRSLGSFVYDLSSWPTSTRRITFTFNLSQPESIAAGHRLVLALQVRGESDHDLVFHYDHPLYQSLLEVATATPLTPQ
jgi:prepilin-type N-terminal cleavage/methylation domain-containing protein